MKKNNLLRYWPLSLILAIIALLAVLVVSSTPAQAISSHEGVALQETQPAVTVVAPTVVVPVTDGGDTIIIDFFSSWVFWAIIGLLVVVFLFALVIRPRSTQPDVHHHHDVDV